MIGTTSDLEERWGKIPQLSVNQPDSVIVGVKYPGARQRVKVNYPRLVEDPKTQYEVIVGVPVFPTPTISESGRFTHSWGSDFPNLGQIS